MPEQKRLPQARRTAKAAAAAVTPTGKLTTSEAVGALSQLVTTVAEVVKVRQTEKTNRAQVEADLVKENARIDATTTIVRDFFDRYYGERRDVHAQLFDNLAHARAAGDIQAMQTAVTGIVEYSRNSPFTMIGDGTALRTMMSDGTVFEV